jgi:hypothetical protein
LEAAAVALQIANVGQNRCDDQGFVMATGKFLMDGIGLDADGQKRAFAVLQRHGIAEVEYRGEPRRRRWVRLDLDRLAALRAATARLRLDQSGTPNW